MTRAPRSYRVIGYHRYEHVTKQPELLERDYTALSAARAVELAATYGLTIDIPLAVIDNSLTPPRLMEVRSWKSQAK